MTDSPASSPQTAHDARHGQEGSTPDQRGVGSTQATTGQHGPSHASGRHAPGGAERVLLGAAIVHGRRVPPEALSAQIHRDVARAIEASDPCDDLAERVDRIAHQLRARSSRASHSDLSRCVLAYDRAGDWVAGLALDQVQDAHRRREIAAVGIALAATVDRGGDVGVAIDRAVRMLRRIA
jgi:hypothetical protein